MFSEKRLGRKESGVLRERLESGLVSDRTRRSRSLNTPDTKVNFGMFLSPKSRTTNQRGRGLVASDADGDYMKIFRFDLIN